MHEAIERFENRQSARTGRRSDLRYISTSKKSDVTNIGDIYYRIEASA